MATNNGQGSSGIQHHHSHRGQRLRKLLHPSGKRIHIAGSPEEHSKLKTTLPKIEPDENFDIYIHGSPEHLEAVREIHNHHEKRRESLREQHAHIYDEVENLKGELDTLAEELHSLTDHGVALDANFSKFGYDAQIRTRDPESSASSLSDKHHDWEAERRMGESLKFWKKPVVRQYFHKGLLWRSSTVEEVGSFELFVDLLYVGIIAIIGDTAAEHPDGYGLVRFAVTFILGWKMWTDITVIISWFEIDDIFQRLCILFVMITLFGYTLNIVQAFETTWINLVGFYLASRLFGAVYYLWMGYLLPMIRGHMYANAALVAIPSALWIASIQLEYPTRLALVWPAIVLDLFGSVFVIFFKTYFVDRVKTESGPKSQKLASYFDFFPAVNIEHKTERTNAFVTLVFGYSVVALLFQNREAGINAFFGKAVLGLMQAFAFNWLYFEIDAWNVHTHAIRRHVLSSMLWLFAHLPFIMGYVLAAAALSKLVLAHDCADADEHELIEPWAERSEGEISDGLRWYYCGGLAVALLCMSLISLSHVHKEFEGQRLKKNIRLGVRLSVAVILICLPLTHHLNSLELVATTTCLIIFVLMVDLWGSTDKNQMFWKCKKSCKYQADCKVRKASIIDALKRGEKVEIKEVHDRQGDTEKGMYE